MGIIAVTSAANHERILCGQEWLKTKRPAEEVLIIGATLGAASEIARNLVREKRAAFGYHRLTWRQLASALARPLLTAQRTVPLGGLGVQAVANRAIHKLSQVGGLGRYANLTSVPGFVRAIASGIAELRLEQIELDALTYLAPDLQSLLQAYERERPAGEQAVFSLCPPAISLGSTLNGATPAYPGQYQVAPLMAGAQSFGLFR